MLPITWAIPSTTQASIRTGFHQGLVQLVFGLGISKFTFITVWQLPLLANPQTHFWAEMIA
ncbi:hypothetical protein [Sinorhizobium sp. NFACC03]|uniref:hypothetical protein n=1 Tax=Sinorhizobium sp. NFACC03 TaxID=1566295 RepID=UPI000880B5B2|nr:hypothetical protein [Sinorhizobium sp. NFACC03]SDA98408.1 hypothetical protein SAMN03159448_06181 [Sinorhizobium sp. NFACC03]